MPSIYISELNGSDSNSGTFSSPYKTLIPVVSGIPQNTDVYLEKNGHYYGVLNLLGGNTIQPYGYGNSPVLSTYSKLIDNDAWEEYLSGIYRLDMSNYFIFSGMYPSPKVGFLNVSGTIYSSLVSSIAILQTSIDMSFYTDCARYLYLKSATNPNAFTDVSFACFVTKLQNGASGSSQEIVICQQNRSDFGVYGIEFNGLGGMPFNFMNVSNIEVMNNRFVDIGGANFGSDSHFWRAGNGIQCWNGVTNAKITNNYLENIYDAGITLQGSFNSYSDAGWTNVEIAHNKVVKANMGLEFWGSCGITPYSNVGFTNCMCYSNIIENSGYNDFYETRNYFPIGVDVAIARSNTPMAELKITNNVFVNGRVHVYYYSTNNIEMDYNVICMNPANLLKVDKSYTIADYASLVEDYGHDANSLWIPMDNDTSNGAIEKLFFMSINALQQSKMSSSNKDSFINPQLEKNFVAQSVQGYGAPTITPEYAGQEYLDKSSRNLWRAVGNYDMFDWIMVTPDRVSNLSTFTNYFGDRGNFGIDSNLDGLADGWTKGAVTVILDDRVQSFTATTRYGDIRCGLTSLEKDSVYYYSVEINGATSVYCQLKIGSEYNKASKYVTSTGDFYPVSKIYTATANGNAEFIISDSAVSGWGETQLKNAYFLNLTEIFGAGNEPVIEDMDSYVAALTSYTTSKRVMKTLGGISEVANLLNALGTYGNFASDSDADGLANGWVNANSTVSLASNEQSVTALGQYSGIYVPTNVTGIIGHVYYYCALCYGKTSINLKLQIASTTNLALANITTPDSWEFVSNIYSNTLYEGLLLFKISDHAASGFTESKFKSVYVFDLTDIFGAGNEPTKSQMDAYMDTDPAFFENKAVGFIDGTVTDVVL
jgi:hypothetical protein